MMTDIAINSLVQTRCEDLINIMTQEECIYCSLYLFSIILSRCIHKENTCLHVGYVYTHEHDLILAHESVANNKQLLTCCMCHIFYCEKCGKEISVPTGSFRTTNKEFTGP
jgi:hypothetical protein